MHFASDFARYEVAFIQDFDACAHPAEVKTKAKAIFHFDLGVCSISAIMMLEMNEHTRGIFCPYTLLIEI